MSTGRGLGCRMGTGGWWSMPVEMCSRCVPFFPPPLPHPCPIFLPHASVSSLMTALSVLHFLAVSTTFLLPPGLFHVARHIDISVSPCLFRPCPLAISPSLHFIRISAFLVSPFVSALGVRVSRDACLLSPATRWRCFPLARSLQAEGAGAAEGARTAAQEAAPGVHRPAAAYADRHLQGEQAAVQGNAGHHLAAAGPGAQHRQQFLHERAAPLHEPLGGGARRGPRGPRRRLHLLQGLRRPGPAPSLPPQPGRCPPTSPTLPCRPGVPPQERPVGDAVGSPTPREGTQHTPQPKCTRSHPLPSSLHLTPSGQRKLSTLSQRVGSDRKGLPTSLSIQDAQGPPENQGSPCPPESGSRSTY